MKDETRKIFDYLKSKYREGGFPNHKKWTFTPPDESDTALRPYKELSAHGFIEPIGAGMGEWRLTDSGRDWCLEKWPAPGYAEFRGGSNVNNVFILGPMTNSTVRTGQSVDAGIAAARPPQTMTEVSREELKKAPVAIAVGIVVVLISAGGGYLWTRLRDAGHKPQHGTESGEQEATGPWSVKSSSRLSVVLTPQQTRFLGLVARHQEELGVRKLVIGRNGSLAVDDTEFRPLKANLVEELFHRKPSASDRDHELEMLVEVMPPEYLRRFPESARWDNPFVVAITEAGTRYLQVQNAALPTLSSP